MKRFLPIFTTQNNPPCVELAVFPSAATGYIFSKEPNTLALITSSSGVGVIPLVPDRGLLAIIGSPCARRGFGRCLGLRTSSVSVSSTGLLFSILVSLILECLPVFIFPRDSSIHGLGPVFLLFDVNLAGPHVSSHVSDRSRNKLRLCRRSNTCNSQTLAIPHGLRVYE